MKITVNAAVKPPPSQNRPRFPVLRMFERLCYPLRQVVRITNFSTKGATEMRRFKSLAAAVIALSAFLLFALGTPAQAQRPHYLHALSNLREARSLLQSDNRPGFIGERDRAIEEIERAIHEVSAAVRDEGRNPHFTPPPAGGDPNRPMRSALNLLDDARGDIASGTDETGHVGLQMRALRHVDEAREILRHALHGMEREHEHRY
jgi:hypothetical protein